MKTNSEPTHSLENSVKTENPNAQKRWALVRNMFKASSLFKRNEAEVVEDIDMLIGELHEGNQFKKSNRQSLRKISAIENYKLSESLFSYIKRSNDTDLEALKELVETHPLKYVRACEDPEYFLNKPDQYGIRPLYEASRNGYFETLQILLDNMADPHLESNGESCLEVASRWNHLVVIKCLLKFTKWSNNELKKAIKATTNEAIRKLLSEKATARLGFCGCG